MVKSIIDSIINLLESLGLVKSGKGDTPKPLPGSSTPVNGSKTSKVDNSDSTNQSAGTTESNSGNKSQELDEEMPSTDPKEPNSLSERAGTKDSLSDAKFENNELSPSESDENKSAEIQGNTTASHNTEETETDKESNNLSDSSDILPPDGNFQGQRKLEESSGINETQKNSETENVDTDTLKTEQSETDSTNFDTLEDSPPQSTESSSEQESLESDYQEDQQDSTTPLTQDELSGPVKGVKTKEPNPSTPRRKKKKSSEKQPWKHPGKRIKLGARQTNSQATKLERKPELICRKSESEWRFDVILTIPEKLNVKKILLNEEELDAESKEHTLTDYSGKLTITPVEGKEIEIKLVVGKNPLIFKMKKYWEGEGRHLKYMTKGHFIVVAPKDWTRKTRNDDETRDDSTKCFDENFKAHYFLVDETSEEPDFVECKIPRHKSGFSLKGKTLDDNSEDGTLYVHSPPELNEISEVLWARVGEEGKKGWGENFKPGEEKLSKVLNGRNGHFFIRVYNKNVELLDSDQFRLSSVLDEIRVNGVLYEKTEKLIPPPRGGHRDTVLRFIDTDGENIVPRSDRQFDDAIQEDGSVLLHASPDNDRTEWIIPSGKYYVTVKIDMPRIWWKIETSENSTNKWCDEPIVKSREEFRSLGNNGASIKFLPESPTQTGYIGLDDNSDTRKIKLKDGIDLSDFLDYEKISEQSAEHTTLKLFIEDLEIDIVSIEADPISPNSEPNYKSDSSKNSKASDKRPVCKPDDQHIDIPTCENEHVMVISEKVFWRRGKGFSKGELVNAGITRECRKYLNISYDKRRKTTHKCNSTLLSRMKKDA